MRNKVFYSLIILLIFSFGNLVKAQQNDIWSGVYVLKSSRLDSIPPQIIDTLTIKKINDAKLDDLPSRLQSDLARWTVHSTKEKEGIEIRQFLNDPKENFDEYKEFGWTDLHAKGQINCFDAGHFFVCQIESNTIVKFSNEESYKSPTGYFGIMLHYGVFDLEKIK